MAYDENKYNPTRNRVPSDFEKRWGMNVHEFAKSENTTPDAIHMRVMRFGTPYQRKNKPTIYEIFYDRTQIELAKELNMNPSSVGMRVRTKGTPWQTALCRPKKSESMIKGFEYYEQKHKQITDPYQRSKTWLHPDHPEYNTWRKEWLERYQAMPKYSHIRDIVPVEESE